MANIKISKLRKLGKESIGVVKEIEIEGLDTKVEIKTYLPVTKKIELATKVYLSSVNEEDGLMTIDRNAEEIALVNCIIEYYTNIELSEDRVESFDLLVSTGIYEAVVNNIVDEFDVVVEVLDNIKDEKFEEFEQKGKLGYLIRSIPAGIEQMKDIIGNFDPEKLEFLKEAVNLTGFTGAEVDGNKKL